MEYKRRDDQKLFSSYGMPSDYQEPMTILPKRTWVPWMEKEKPKPPPPVTIPDPFYVRMHVEIPAPIADKQDSIMDKELFIEEQDKRDRAALRQEYAAKPKWVPRRDSQRLA